jgi:hypothetical protein
VTVRVRPGAPINGDNMSNDLIKAALEKKKAALKQPGKKSSGNTTKGIHGSQVSTNKPAKKSAGRGR